MYICVLCKYINSIYDDSFRGITKTDLDKN